MDDSRWPYWSQDITAKQKHRIQTHIFATLMREVLVEVSKLSRVKSEI